MVGEQVELSVLIDYDSPLGCEYKKPEKMAGNLYAWSVKPSEGATVKDGVFVASKPGECAVTPIKGPKAFMIAPCFITVEGTAAETTGAKLTVPSIILFSDGVVSNPINSSESDFFSKLTLEQGVIDSSGGYYLGADQTVVDGCIGTMSGIYSPDTRQFTGEYWNQVEIGPKLQPDERYIMKGTFSEVIGHGDKVTLKLEGTQYHEKLNYAEDENGVWLYKDRVEWSETIDFAREVTFTVIGLD